MRQACLRTCSFVLAVFGGIPAAGADIYMRQDTSGVIHYTNAPTDDQYQLLVAVMREEVPENRAKAKPVASAAQGLAPSIEEAALVHNVDKALIHAVISVESGYKAAAVSPKGAQGLMQLMPMTAKRYSVADALDPVQNIHGGTRYLSDLLRMFDNNTELAVAAYNAGENAVVRSGRQIPPYRETRDYVPRVMRLYEKYKRML
jgi:soluble lytic murein transglycosylase-like protein